MIEFVSTRNKTVKIDARNAIVNGLAPDGGLYVPTSIPQIDYKALSDLSYTETAKRILGLWFESFTEGEISDSCEEAYLPHFDTEEVAPVVKAGDTYIVELFHGETCAFKDVALSLLPRLLVRAKKSLGIEDSILILTATSGDTGSAAMNGFRDVDGTGIITFFPHGGVSQIQRRQMVCMPGKNLTACAIKGNFDDCQTAVKNAFATLPRVPGVRYSSANSINIARLVPQITYYFTTYRSLVKSGTISEGDKVDFVVPTGNFGDILAGYYAKRMGLPVGNLICASNANNVLTDFLRTGVYDRRREFLKTCSPSMDILISSNLERLLYHVQGENCELVASQMAKLRSEGIYSVSAETLAEIKETFEAYCFDDAATLETVGSFFRETGYLADPHTAVAVSAAKARENGNTCAVLATASPFKFPESAFTALGLEITADRFEMLETLEKYAGIKAPEYLSRLRNSEELHTDVIEKSEINNYITEMQSKLV